MDLLKILNKSFGTYNVRGIYIEPTYWMAGVIVLLIFLLLFTIARVRWLYVHWNLGKSAYSMLFWGFLLALILEGFLWIGGKSFLTVVLGWKNAPKPISTALDVGRGRLVDVLGETEEIPESLANESPTYQSIISDYENLSSEDKEAVKSFICAP
ncbi:hypothetical protein A2865_03040 [Candidatus Woesebacteria bacterium RIFCSPHIGHO2_01_FULL_39_17]|uniref:Uncharacterized protein n=3 Tax=Candidatus Woeseibacteriota TaxID=1752722 RepID=A0A0G0RIV5_9BACT|nr:MAG: hypothetical protein US72_C0018G0009 [Microgenomates group bacterium GW2011_GWC1_38_12]KKQ94119.1 MAG: hypothetical protein UT19_C0004G0080 [Candidatus Woesebacteria bacterium GW2011_GWB1_39_10b]KKR13577.1 MAG: hypothetical protein UT40_C0014G0033 [Candidatus Woesebacteria bacterium GW2011_GWA1_39_21b]OGM22538.1 MAG: hypothetical protein A2865_03040 [Candidatus Woesebacteria bacterium RIFCSPHIGHO2_01_FULL_39_17]OGM63662.1 MAG: hypothetical protein A3A52_02455 [Candidatus Woesebacteria b